MFSAIALRFSVAHSSGVLLMPSLFAVSLFVHSARDRFLDSFMSVNEFLRSKIWRELVFLHTMRSAIKLKFTKSNLIPKHHTQ